MTSAKFSNASQQTDPKRIEAAQQAIAAFEQSKLEGVWTALNKPQAIAEMRSRISNPFSVNQGQQPFCGPASVVFELVRTNPVRYVEICRNLFEIGGFHGHTKWIPASERLRQCQGELQMPQVDWMILSTLRETENLLFPVEPDAPEIIRNLGGMTKSWELKGWVREVLGYRQIQYIHAYLMGDLRALRRASEAIAAGGAAFALVTAEGLLTQTPPLVPYPSHWIALLGDISIQPDTSSHSNRAQIGLDVYTWGRKMHIDIDERLFKNYFWGVVIAWP